MERLKHHETKKKKLELNNYKMLGSLAHKTPSNIPRYLKMA